MKETHHLSTREHLQKWTIELKEHFEQLAAELKRDVLAHYSARRAETEE